MQSSALVKVLEKNGSPALFGGALSTTAWRTGSYANSATFAATTPYHATSNGASETGLSGDVLHFFNNALGGGVPFFGSGGNATTPASDLSVVGGVAKSTVGTVTSVGAFLGKISNPTTLKNVGIFVLGAMLVIGGVVIFVSQTKTVKGAEQVAVKAA